MIEQIDDIEIVSALLAGTSIPPEVQVSLLTTWQIRNDFVVDVRRLAAMRGKDIPIQWIQPLPSDRASATPLQASPTAMTPRGSGAADGGFACGYDAIGSTAAIGFNTGYRTGSRRTLFYL